MSAKAIQVCGTGSGVGKSVIAAGLCRVFLQDGFKVAPFKAQNMSLNSFVTAEGAEIGRAQAMQAAACRLNPSADMNPVLLKPSSDTGSQVILQGKPVGNMSAAQYLGYKDKAWLTVLDSFNRLKKNFEIVVIEGAGSPAEVNLKSQEIVNMKMAKAADAPVVLVGDIDKGGVFAWLVGTLELLTKKERRMIKGIIINKFRGDKGLLQPGIDFLEKKTGIKVLGVVPYFSGIRIPEEDSVALDSRAQFIKKAQAARLIDISVIKLPRISNFTDFAALENEPDVRLRYASDSHALADSDVIIIPGTKNTIADLAWLRKQGLACALSSALNSKGGPALIGVCGGFQMLGEKICDRHNVESGRREIKGLGLLPFTTNFKKEKILAQVKARDLASGLEVSGYEIHHGRTENGPGLLPAFKIIQRRGKRAEGLDGCACRSGRVWGTYIHGVFDNDVFRRDFLNRLRERKGWPALRSQSFINVDAELDKLAQLLRDNLDMPSLYKFLPVGP